MKKYIKIISIVSFLAIISLISCTDESTFKNPIHYDLLKTGAFPKLKVPAPSTIGASTVNDIDYSFTVIDINNSIDTYSLQVAATLNGIDTPFYDVETVNSFPADFSFNSQELSDLLGVPSSNFNFGDTFKFRGSCISKDGIAYDVNSNTSAALYTTGYDSAFQFEFVLACPGELSVNDLVGVWAITVDDFGVVLDDGMFQMIAGPGDNQLTLIDPFGHVDLSGSPFNVVMDIDPSTSTASISTQDSWNSAAYDLAYGIGRITGSEANVFNCVGNGSIDFTFNYTVDAGSFGSERMVFTKL